jgi:hypothetical protein
MLNSLSVSLTSNAIPEVLGLENFGSTAGSIPRALSASPRAREALIRLSRGNDFGPQPTATTRQIAQAVQAWRQWLALQDPPERIPECLDRPQLAEAEGPSERVREALPSPQLTEAEDAQP